MYKYSKCFLFSFFFALNLLAQTNQINYTFNDSICQTDSLQITNLTNFGSKYYWSFCNNQQSFNLNSAGIYSGGGLSGPVRMSIAHDNSGFYGFLSNYFGNFLTRLDFGNSFSNAPTATNMGTFSGQISIYSEGINVRNDGGHWYGFQCAEISPNSHLLRFDFGTSLSNTPIVTNLGNFGNALNLPHGLDFFKIGNNWIGFIVNANNNNLIRFDFGTSLSNIPTETDLGNIASFSYPTTIKFLEKSGTWYGFVTSRDNSSLAILNFGNNLLNTPTGTNLGNLGVLFSPFDIKIFNYCDTTVGFITDNSLNVIYKVIFNSNNMNIIGNPTVALNGVFSSCEGMSETYRQNDTLFWYVCNAGNNSITKVYFNNCNSSIGSYGTFNPPHINFNTLAIQQVSLTVDEGESTQQSLCENISILNSKTTTKNYSLCAGDSIKIGTSYYKSNISIKDTFHLLNSCDSIVCYNVKVNSPGITQNNVSICQGNFITVGTHTYNVSGQYTDTLNAVLACDSVIKTNLSVVTNFHVAVNKTLCYGKVYSVGTHNYWQNGVYTDTLGSSFGCDSIIISTLNFNPLISGNVYLYQCNNEALIFNGKEYISTGIFSDTLKSRLKCDSIIYVHIIADSSVSNTVNIFTPNNDGINERLIFPFQNRINDVTIYDRWGLKVFNSSNNAMYWDGKLNGNNCSGGTYYYVINLSCGNGKSKLVKGFLELIR